jgi:hypothetical protein
VVVRLKRHISNEALCPFYRSEDGYRVVCEGVVKASSIHVVFPSSTKKQEYCKKYCCGDYNACRVSTVLYAKYGGDDK